jgi:DNA-binding NarL/FixJ family response regulator
MTKRVVIADDHAFVSWGLSKALSALDDIEVSSCVTNGIEAIAEIRRLRPDCAVLDYNMPGATGLEVFLEAKRWSADTRFVLLTGAAARETLHAFVDAGVHGICLKTSTEAEVVDTIRQVCAGRRVIGRSVAELLQTTAQSVAITERELAVLHAIARGHTNATAAEHLGISAKTVDTHRTRLMRAFSVSSSASLIVAAMKAGLIDHESLR